MKRVIIAAAALAALAAYTPSARAATVYCPNAPISTSRDTQLKLDYDGGALTATCYDYGGVGPGPAGQYTVGSGPVVLDNKTLELPNDAEELQKTEGALAAGPYFSGPVNESLTGTTTFNIGSTGTFYLTYKTGSGQNDPFFFAFALTGVNAGDSVTWTVIDPDRTGPPGPAPNALSNLALFGNPDFDIDPDCVPGTPDCPVSAPEPASLALLGLGLLGVAYGRRRKQ